MTLKSEIPSSHLSILPSSILTISSSHNFLPGGPSSTLALHGGSNNIVPSPGGSNSIVPSSGGSRSLVAPPGEPKTGGAMTHSGIYRLIPQGTVDNSLGPDRLAGPIALDSNHLIQQTLV